MPFTPHTLSSMLIDHIGMMAVFEIPLSHTKHLRVHLVSADGTVPLCLHRENLDPLACVVKMVQKDSRVSQAPWETLDPQGLLEKRHKSLIIFVINILKE